MPLVTFLLEGSILVRGASLVCEVREYVSVGFFAFARHPWIGHAGNGW